MSTRLRLLTALAILLLSTACSHSSAATQPKTITPAERQARWHNMKLALETYNNVVQSTRDDFKYCELLSGTNANQCFATTLQPLHASLVRVNIAMQALVEGATSTGTCVSYLHETIKRGNAVANGYEKVIQALSESDDAKAAVLRLRGLAQPSKWWRQDTAAMATTCGTPGK